jgi:hypothetical protein
MQEPDKINYIVLDSTESEAQPAENNNQQVKNKSEQVAINFKREVRNWFKGLTTVQAGTLHE